MFEKPDFVTQLALAQRARKQRQCERCRHSCRWKADLVCLRRLSQRCRDDGDTQRLELAPGLCAVINPDKDCPEFKRRFKNRLTETLEDALLLLMFCTSRRRYDDREWPRG